MGIDTPTEPPAGDRSSWGRRRAGRYVGATVMLAGLSTVAVGTAAQAAPKPAHPTVAVSAPYRHGMVPMRGLHATPQATCGSKCMAYGGGINKVGVTTGKEKVYLVFWGSQWGTAGTSGAYTTFSGDPSGMAVILQKFFTGLGTGGEQWSGVMTQYCQGISAGSKTCPSTAKHVAYPTGGALAGIWEDTSKASPAQSTGHQLAVEAEHARAHFGNTTWTENRDAQYVIVSPTGTNPDNYQSPVSGFCAWHDYTGDTTLDGGGAATGLKIAFTNLPYITDVGAVCGAGAVDGKNTDGITIVEGHEYAETITDQFPAGGWTVPSGSFAGEETGDLCAWVTSGAGRMQDITLTTGTFAVQGTWSNLNNACEVAHATVT
jgi:serine protease